MKIFTVEERIAIVSQDTPEPEIEYTLGEDIANSVTHGIGVALGIAGLAVLVSLAAREGDPWRIVSLSIYGTTLILMFLASTLYHSLRIPRVHRLFRILDHSAIFLLIAGTYTPFTLVTLRGPWGWTLFGIVWGLAAVGIVLKTIFIERFAVLSAAIYIAMGWVVVLAFKPLLDSLPGAGVLWLVAGGVCYTGGVFFFAAKRIPYNHAIWHLFVLSGSICHFIAILLYVLPAPQTP